MWVWPGRIQARPLAFRRSPTGPSDGMGYGTGRTVRIS